MELTKKHEEQHIKDGKKHYGKDVCKGVPDGYLPVGGPGYTDMLNKSECEAYKAGKTCRENALKEKCLKNEEKDLKDGIERDKAQIKNTANRKNHICFIFILFSLVICGGCSKMNVSENDARHMAITEFELHHGEGSHREYDLSAREDAEQWIIHFDRKDIAIPGHHYVVFVYKDGKRTKYMHGE